MNDRMDRLEAIVRDIFAKSTQRKYWEHTKRVYVFADYLGRQEGADLDVLHPAVLLHDIGMTIDAGYPSHIEKSKLLAEFILPSLGYEDSAIHKIVTVLGSHHPSPGAPLATLEEQVLYDADNMEIVGAFGVLRWIGTMPATSAELIGSIDLFVSIVDACVSARGSLFFTDTARKVGDAAVKATMEYYSAVKDYLSQFENDCKLPMPGRL